MALDTRQSTLAISLLLILLLLYCIAPSASAQPVVITEFLAANQLGIEDVDGDDEDWVEIYNADPGLVNLNGWHLTDDAEDLGKWTFPATNLPPYSYMIVFASGKDRAIGGAELHTNFRLARENGYLALVRPNGTIASEFGSSYPPQKVDVSYGQPQEIRTVFGPGAAVKWLVPVDASLGTNWIGGNQSFNDDAWFDGSIGIGFLPDEVGIETYSVLVQNDPGVVAYWRLGEPSGTIAADLVGSNDGLLTGGPSRAGWVLSSGDTAPAVAQTAQSAVSQAA